MNKIVIKSEIIEENNLKTKKIYLNKNLTINTEFELLINEIKESLENFSRVEINTEKNAIIDASFVQIVFSALLISKERKNIKLNLELDTQTLELIKKTDLLKLIT